MRVNLERIKELRDELRKINSTELVLIDFYHKGKKLEISDKAISNWRHIGLSNVEFIETGYYMRDENIENTDLASLR